MNYEQEIIDLKKRIEELERILTSINPIKKEAQKNDRDKTKYIFEGKVYAKNRLVLSVVKNFVLKNNPTYTELTKFFDKSLQGSLGVVELYSNAIKVSDAKKRFFLKDEDIIFLPDAKIVVCTQWGIFNIVKFIKQAKTLGFDIETI